MFHRGQTRRQRARIEHVGEVGRRLHGEAALDDAGAARNRISDHGRRDDGVIKHDGEASAPILGGRVRERAGARRVETEVHRRLAVLVKGLTGVDQLLACDQRTALDRKEGFAGPFGGQDHHAGRRSARAIGINGHALFHHVEGQTRGRPDNIDDALRIVFARHLDEHAVLALTRDIGLGGAGGVHAATDDLDGLGHGALTDGVQGRLGNRHPDGAIIIAPGDGEGLVETLGAGRCGDRLAQLLQPLHGPVHVFRPRQADQHLAFHYSRRPGQQDRRILPQGASGVILQVFQTLLTHFIHVHLEDQV